MEMNELNWQEGHIKIPTIYARNGEGWTGMVAVPSLQGLTMTDCGSRDEIEKKLRTSTVTALAFYARYYDLCRKRALWIKESSPAGWWFTIFGLGMSYDRETKKFRIVNVWKND